MLGACMSWQNWNEKPWHEKLLTMIGMEILLWIVVGLGIGLYGLVSFF
jgi:hypothetical protein